MQSARNLFLLVIFVFVTPQSTFAKPIHVAIQQAKPVGNFSIGVGSSTVLTLPTGDQLPRQFLGKLVQPNRVSNQTLFLDERRHQVDIIPDSELRWNQAGSVQPILNPYAQVGGTCAGYAIFHFLNQFSLSEFSFSPNFTQTLSTEAGRTQLLAQSLTAYYIEGRAQSKIKPILNNVLRAYDLKCTSRTFDDRAKAIAFVRKNLDQGNPIVVEFLIGNTMVNTDDEILFYGSKTPEDLRLWVPRIKGQRNSGGHAIVLAASFEQSGSLMAVAVDSDWNAPRVWNVDRYLGQSEIDEVEFHTCK